MKPVTVRVQTLDGTWEVPGVDRGAGVWAENHVLEADRWGSSKASFDLHRRAGAVWPDIAAFTPVEFEVAGFACWSGRVQETPSRDGADQVMSVQCEGWQYHLDDDPYERPYIHDRLSDWKDRRAHPASPLGSGFVCASGQVNTGAGIQLSFPHNTVVQTNDQCAAMIDLGPGNTVARIVIKGTTSNNNNGTPQAQFSLSAGPNPDGFGSTALINGSALTTMGANFGPSGYTPVANSRYVFVILHWNAGGTATNDAWVKIASIKLFAATAYESGNDSILKAPTVLKDALTRACPLLSTDQSQIDPNSTVTFNIPSLAPGEPRTPRENWNAGNAWHDYITQIDVSKRGVFKPKPAAPTIEVGEWSASEVEDASANSGDDIYNKVIVTAQTPDGQPVRSESVTGILAEYRAEDLAITNPNPSFATDTTGWTDSGADVVILRVTDDFDTGPASGRVDTSTGSVGTVMWVQSPNFSGTFLAGQWYVLTVWVKALDSRVLRATVKFGEVGDEAILDFPIGTTIHTRTVYWKPTADRTAARVRVEFVTNGINISGALYVDSLQVFKATKPTLVERRGFTRTKILPVQANLPGDLVAARQLGETWLRGHEITPFKGTAKLTGDACRDILTGAPVGPERLLTRTMELLRFSDRVDPDNGGQARDGRMAQIAYRPAVDEAVVTIDNSRATFEALLERLAVVTGQGR